MNSKPSLTVMCSAEPSSLALAIGFGVLSSDGSAWLNAPSSFSAIREGVTVPVKPDPSRTRIIVEKQQSGTVTSAMLGAFRARKETRDEFLSLVAAKNHPFY